MRTARIMAVPILAVLLLTVGAGPTVSAHVLVRDDHNGVGAVIHIAPDDDPVAGEQSSLYFDIQGRSFDNAHYIYALTVQDAQGVTATLPVTVSGSLAIGSYVFPAQGPYQLTLTVKPKAHEGNVAAFVYTQQVSRGVPGAAPATPHSPWADTVFICCGVALLLLAAVGYRKRHEIMTYSKLR